MKPKEPIWKSSRFWAIVLISIIVLTGAYFLFFYPGFQLKNITVSGNIKINSQDIEGIVSEHANTGLVDIGDFKVSSRSIFLVNEQNTIKDILNKFPGVESVTMNKSLPQTLVLGITERKPLGAYCDKSNKCYLIDQNGIIFEPISMPAQDATIVRQVIESGQVFNGEQVITKKIIEIIYKIQKSLKDNFQINLTEALVASPIRLDVQTNKNWKVYFDLNENSDINLQLTKLNLLLGGGMSDKEKQNLKYIDLRPKDRAIICDNSTCGG